jgi:hypothetical protein
MNAQFPTQYKAFFHLGDELTLKTHVEQGRAWVDAAGLHVENSSASIFIPQNALISSRIFRLHGLGRVIEVDHRGGRLFVSVVRLMIGQFAFINFFKTGGLNAQIEDIIGALNADSSRQP